MDRDRGRRLGRMLAAISALLGIGAAQADPDGSDFERLLAAAKENPARADYHRLRVAYVRSPAYDPYNPSNTLETGSVDQEVANGERVAALLALDRMIEGHWLDLNAHLYAARACARLGEDSRAEMHAQFHHGLLRAILDAGDGRTFETAWPVIGIEEEYHVLMALRLGVPRQQSLVHHDGHDFDVLTLPGPVEGDEVKVYFNVDVPRQWLARRLANRRPDEPEGPPP